MADKRFLYNVIVCDAKKETILSEKKVFGFGRDDVLGQIDIKNLAQKEGAHAHNISVIIIELGEIKESSKYDKVIVVKDETL